MGAFHPPPPVFLFMKKILFIVISVLFLSAGSCEKENGNDKPAAATLSVDCSSIAVAYAKTVQTIMVTSDCEWGVSSDDKSWISVSPSGGGSGVSAVKVTIEENAGESARESGITFRYADSQLSVPVKQNYKVEAVEIADEGFLKALLKAYDKDGDGILSKVEAAGVDRIEASGYGIKSMPELGSMFKDITYLDCSNNDLESIDIQNLFKLTYFDCRGNEKLGKIMVWSGFTGKGDFFKPEKAEYIAPEITTPAGYTLVWNDEFAGESVDNKKWRFENWPKGYVNNELQRYVSGGVLDGHRTAFQQDGALHITAMKYGNEVISARMNTMASWKYGYMEARIRLPKGKGTWPAFWMMPTDQSKGWPTCGEIDIMEEVGVNANYTSSSIHCKAYNHPKNTQKTKERLTKNAESEYHTYAVEWTEDGMWFYVDGVHDNTTLTFLNDKKGDEATWPFDKPFYITLNLAWGGDWGGWNGVDEGALPTTMDIDYVRVFQKL